MNPFDTISVAQSLAKDLGRTPTQTEFRAAGIPKRLLPYIVTLAKLTPRKPGEKTGDNPHERLYYDVKAERHWVAPVERPVKAYVSQAKRDDPLNPNETWMA